MQRSTSQRQRVMMRNLQAAALVTWLGLVGLALAAAPEETTPEPIATRQNLFSVPFRIEPARSVVLSLWSDRVAERSKQPGVKDYKTRLQELTARDGVRPEYRVEGTGPDHDRRFKAVVYVKGVEYGAGEGRSKKESEQDAAREALEALIRDSR